MLSRAEIIPLIAGSLYGETSCAARCTLRKSRGEKHWVLQNSGIDYNRIFNGFEGLVSTPSPDPRDIMAGPEGKDMSAADVDVVI